MLLGAYFRKAEGAHLSGKDPLEGGCPRKSTRGLQLVSLAEKRWEIVKDNVFESYATEQGSVNF